MNAGHLLCCFVALIRSQASLRSSAMSEASATALERDTVFRKLRSKPENKACLIPFAGCTLVVDVVLCGWSALEAISCCVPLANSWEGKWSCWLSTNYDCSATPYSSARMYPAMCSCSVYISFCAPGVLRLPCQEPYLGVSAVWRLHLPGMRWRAQVAGRAPHLCEVGTLLLGAQVWTS